MPSIPDSAVIPLNAALAQFGMLDRVKFPTPDFDPSTYRVVIEESQVCASTGESDRGRLFVHCGGGVSLLSWAQAGGEPGHHFRLAVGWAVVVVKRDGRQYLELVGTA